MPQPTNSTNQVTLHPTLHNAVFDVKMYGAVGDGVTDDTTAIQNALTAGAAKMVLFPPGTYFLADGSGLTIPQSTTVRGMGRRVSIISTKNAYAFTATSVDTLLVENFGFTLRAGSTTGGAVKFNSVSSSGMHDCEGSSVSTSTDPVFYGKGVVGVHFDRLQAQGATAPGIKLDGTGTTLAFCNANTISRSRANSTQGSTNGGIYLHAAGCSVIECIIESNRGYGLDLSGSGNRVIDNWFEDNSNHNILAADCISNVITGNKIHYNHGDIGTAEHIKLTGTAGQRHHSLIAGNMFTDVSSSGTAVDIGAGVEFTQVSDNRGASLVDGTIVDSGTSSYIIGNDNGGSTGDRIAFAAGATTRKLPRIKTNRSAAGSGGDPTSAEAIFTAENSAGTNYFMVGSEGFPIFRTGDKTQWLLDADLQTNSFSFYWDEATQKVMARFRNNAGTYSTAALF